MPDEKELRDMSADEIAQLTPAKFRELADKHNDGLETRENRRNRRDERTQEQWREETKGDYKNFLFKEREKTSANQPESIVGNLKLFGRAVLDSLTFKDVREADNASVLARIDEEELRRNAIDDALDRHLPYPSAGPQYQLPNKPLREMNLDEIAQLTTEKFSDLAHEHNDYLELRENAAERVIVDSKDRQETAISEKAEIDAFLSSLYPKPLSALDRRMAKKIEEAKVERSEGRMAFQSAYDSVTEAAEKSLEEHRQIVQDGLARGFLKRDEFDRIAETSPDGDHRVRPGQKLATDQLKGMEDKERKALLNKVDEAVTWAAFAYGAEHSRGEEWRQPEKGINDRPAEKLVTRDLGLTDEAKQRAKRRSRGRSI